MMACIEFCRILSGWKGNLTENMSKFVFLVNCRIVETVNSGLFKFKQPLFPSISIFLSYLKETYNYEEFLMLIWWKFCMITFQPLLSCLSHYWFHQFSVSSISFSSNRMCSGMISIFLQNEWLSSSFKAWGNLILHSADYSRSSTGFLSCMCCSLF